MTPSIRQMFLLTLMLSIGSPVFAELWPQFRGADGRGVSSESDLPSNWSEHQGIAWVQDLPGRSNSSPAVTQHRLDLTTQTDDHGLWVLSLDRATGKILRKTQVGSGQLAAKGAANLYKHRHNAATPSPVADEASIYAFFGTGLLVCLDAESHDLKWRRDMTADFGAYDITFGMGSSPRLWRDRLFISCMTKGPSYVIALHKDTGEKIWSTDRKLPAQDDGPDAYSTPVIWQGPNGPQLLISGSDHVNAYDPMTGRQLWISDGLSIDSPYGRIIASPIAGQGIVVATTGDPGGGGKGHMIAVDATLSGDVSDRGRRWKYAKTTPDSSSPIIVDNKVYSVTDSGIVSCLDLQDGSVIWQKRLTKGPYHASIVAGDRKLYLLGIDGNCTVMDTSTSEATVLGVNRLPGTFYATPAISDGTIYLRAYERIFAVRGQK